ncbi:hypothetical protein [Rhizobium rhizogenes]|uniref:hypothetical protein n=1 Tax=Rhizobium rhizogenes TaxID=359 RepID=UPI00157276BD|nr:hypothetical protein [Rhizobium rhizogenes]
MNQNLDLFGNPFVVSDRKVGRPAHEATEKTRNRVKMLVALGWANPRIANALAISLPTLRKNYFHELKKRDAARDQLEMRRLEMAWQLAEAGNVGAFKEFGRLMERNDQMMAAASFTNDGEPKKEKKESVGKKEAAAQAAENAGENSEWGDDLRFPGTVN